MKSRALKFICILAVCILLAANTLALEPTENFFANDFANIISSSDEAEMQKLGESLHYQTTAQVCVVTVNDMGGKSIDDFCIKLARDWGIGTAEDDNGVLLLLALKEREVKIEVGSGLEGALTDAKCGRILDTYGMEYFTEDDFSTGLYQVYDAVVNEVALEILGEPLSEEYDAEKTEEGDLESIGSIMGVIAVIIFVIVFSNGGRGGGGFGGFGGGHGGGGGFSGGGGGFSGGGSSRGF